MDWIEEVNSGESMLDRALALWEMGFHVFPLGSPHDPLTPQLVQRFGSEDEARLQWPKTPRISWARFQIEQPTREEVEEWWTKWPQANIAIATGVQFDVVDADSEEAVAWCRENLTRTPWESHTGRGVQFLYRKTELDVRNSANAATKVDTRGVGGYIVAPGSTHSSGRVYQLVVDEAYGADSIDDLPALTEGDLVKIRGFRDPIPQGALSFSIDTTGYSAGALDEAGVEKGGRNVKAAALAGKYIAEGDDYQTAKAKLAQWNQSNIPPLTDFELKRTLESVIKTHLRNHPDQLVRPAPLPISQESNDGLVVYNVADIMDNPPQKPEFLWGGPAIFKGARIMIVGRSKAGKSRFLLDALAAMATGGEFLGEQVQRPMKCLWLNAEIHKAWLKDRLAAKIRSTPDSLMPLLRENLHLTGRLQMNLLNPIHFETIRQMIVGTGAEAVAFDPFINFSPCDENSNTEMQAVLGALNSLQALTGVTIIVVHHGRKGSKKFDQDLFDTIRGASALRGWYDTGIVLIPDEGAKNSVTIAWELRNGEGRPAMSATWNQATGCYEVMTLKTMAESPDGASKVSATELKAAEVYEWLGDARCIDQWFTVTDLLDFFGQKWGVGKSTVEKVLQVMKNMPDIVVDIPDQRNLPAKYCRRSS